MGNITELYSEWKSLQPVEQAIQDNINRKFMLEFNYNSNHIEGNTLTYGQTELLLMFGQVDSSAKMQDLEEMKAHNVGLQMMQAEANSLERPLTEYFIRELHRTLLREDYTVQKDDKKGNIITYTVHVGQYKTRPNSVITPTGERFDYATPEETPALMRDLVEWYNTVVQENNLSAIELASLFHYRYIRIHPFEDGNGRIARLLVNFILLRAGYPMIIVRSNDKNRYLSILNKCDIEVGLTPFNGANAQIEQIMPFVDYMSECLERALSLRIKAAKGESIEEEDDWKKEIILNSHLRKNKPARTVDFTTKAIRESFIPTIKELISSLDICKEVCFGIDYSVSTGDQYQTPRKVAEFYSFAEKNTFKFHVRLNIKFRIAEFLPKYDITTSVECRFKEFEYEIVCKQKGQDHIIKLNYGCVPSTRQINKLVSFIGRHVAEVYAKYRDENTNE